MDITKIRIGQLDLRDLEGSPLASANSVNEVQGNLIALSANATVSNDWVNANDYSTLLSAQSNDYTTYLQAQSNDYSTLIAARSNDYSTYTTLEANLYNTYTTLSANPSNTNIYAGNVNLANTTVFIQAGDGVVLESNTTSKTLTIATSMSNVTSQTIAISGTSNVFSLTKSAANANMILVMYNGLVQDPARYTIVDSTLTLLNTAPLIAGANVEVRYFDFFSLPGSSSGVGGGDGGESYSFQGSVSGYSSGGEPVNNTVDKFPFSSDGNAVNVGDITQARFGAAGQSSSSSGYTSGGYIPAAVNTIDKFPFSIDSNATDVGDLTVSRRGVAGQSSSTNGYTSAGNVNTIDKFPFASNSNASDVGDLTRSQAAVTGQSSTVSGYSSGGNSQTDIIDKFSFSTDGNATDVGNLTQARFGTSGHSSTVSGYNGGGLNPSLTPSIRNIIDKFPFANDANATDVGDLSQARRYIAGQSSTISGYSAGGDGGIATIDKFPFATDTNATSVGNLYIGRGYAAGQQV